MKGLKYILYVLLVASLVVAIYFYMATPQSVNDVRLDVLLGWAYALIAVAIVVALIFPLISIFKSGKSILKFVVGLIVVGAVVFGAYTLASPEALATVEATPGELKLTDTVLYIAYLMVAVSVLALLGTSLVNSIKNR